jgi:hypothetical protein
LIQYSIDNPFLLSTKLSFSKEEQDRMVHTVDSQISTGNYHGGYTFVVEDNTFKDFSKLYNNFFNICLNMFGPFSLSKMYRASCWANVYNKNNYRSNMHNHLRTSTINAVFYLKMPAKDGGISVIYNDQKFLFLPDELEMIIMPSWMPHEPMPHDSLQNRISINMEIACNESASSIFTEQAIQQYGIINV